MDPLSDIIALLRPSAAISKPITGRGRWGVRYASHGAPAFTLILRGECWLDFGDEAPMRLQRGDFLLLPATPSFALSSHEGEACALREPVDAPVRHGEQDGEATFASLGGTFRIERANAPLLLELLPRRIYIPAEAGHADRLRRVVELIMEECASEAPGQALVLGRLLDVLLVEALRWRAAVGDAEVGLLRGMHDPALSRALGAMHEDVRAAWTVARLAKIAGMSRSSFAARFAEALGCGPIEHLTRWRIALAKDALRGGAKTLDQIAAEVGYGSASALSAAFRRREGCAPGQLARTLRPEALAEA